MLSNNKREIPVFSRTLAWYVGFVLTSAATGTLAAEEAVAQAPLPPPRDPTAPGGDAPKEMKRIRVEEAIEEEGIKAETQTGASKMELTLRETPQSVSVITREALEARQVITLGQALEMSAGVTQYSGNGPFAGQPSFGFNQTTIRGIAIDDLYDFRDDGFVSGSYYQVPDLAIYDRLEVVKGANSILYGRGSAGGLINRVRKKPLAGSHADLQLSVGSFDTYRADADLTGPLTASGALRGRLVAAYQDEGTFVDGPESQRTVVAPSLDVDLSARTRLLLQALYQGEDIIPNTGVPLRAAGTNYDAPRVPRRQYNGLVTREPYTWETKSANAQLEHEIGDRWLATLRLASSAIDTPIQVDAYAYGFREGDDPDTVGIVERRGDTSIIGSDYAIDREIWSGELQLSGGFSVAGRDVNATFGIDHNQNEYARRGIYYNNSGFYAPGADGNLYDGIFNPADRSDPLVGSRFGGDPRSTGFYAQGQIHATERLKVLLGARYDDVELRSFNGATKDRENVSDLTGRIGVTYDLSALVSVYGLYAQSFNPVLFDTGADGQLLDPETGEVFEIGAKSDWFDSRLGVTAAVYRIDRNDIPIDADVSPGQTPYSVSSGLQRSDGFEVEINGQPLPGWDIALAYNRVDSEFKDPRDPFFGIQPGGTADWQLGLFTRYEIQNGPLRGLGFGATAFAIDDRGVSTSRPGTIPGYERFDLHASYRGWKAVDVSLVVRNVTDEVYIEGADRPTAYAQFGSPTAAMLSVRYHLGAE